MRSTTFFMAALIAGVGCTRDARTTPSARIPAEAGVYELALQTSERTRVTVTAALMAQAIREEQPPSVEPSLPPASSARRAAVVAALVAPTLPKPPPRKVPPPPPPAPVAEAPEETPAPSASEPAPPPPRPAPAPVARTAHRPAPPPVAAVPPERDDFLPSTPAAVSAVVGLGGLSMGAMAVGIGDGAPSYPLMAVGLGIAGAGFLTAGILYIGERSSPSAQVAVGPGAMHLHGRF